MRKGRVNRLAIIVFVYWTISTVLVLGFDTPYRCLECQNSFATEELMVSHFMYVHKIDLQINGDLQQHQIDNFEFPEYLPVAFYICPETGLGFFTEAQLCWHLHSQ